jgi:hypothetical protein
MQRSWQWSGSWLQQLMGSITFTFCHMPGRDGAGIAGELPSWSAHAEKNALMCKVDLGVIGATDSWFMIGLASNLLS